MSSYAKMTVADLKAELKKKGLDTNGLKKDLVERLEASGGCFVKFEFSFIWMLIFHFQFQWQMKEKAFFQFPSFCPLCFFAAHI